MRSFALIMACLAGTAGLASAATVVSYNVTAGPGSSPDATDNNGTAVDVWQESQTNVTGGSGSYSGNVGTLTNAWILYSYPYSTGAAGGSVDENHTFDGGAVSVGQTVSINVANSSIDAGYAVGFTLTGTSLGFTFTGGDSSGHYRYADAGGTGQDTGLGFQYQKAIAVSYTLTSATTYTATASAAGATPVTWSGTYSGSVTGIDVFNHNAGNSSDFGFNGLAVSGTPEPATLGLFGVVGVAALGRRRR